MEALLPLLSDYRPTLLVYNLGCPNALQVYVIESTGGQWGGAYLRDLAPSPHLSRHW
jgi:hypothetical protein